MVSPVTPGSAVCIVMHTTEDTVFYPIPVDDLRAAIQRACNTWPDIPPSILQLSDILTPLTMQ